MMPYYCAMGKIKKKQTNIAMKVCQNLQSLTCYLDTVCWTKYGIKLPEKNSFKLLIPRFDSVYMVWCLLTS